MNWQGNISIGETIDVKFTTVNSSGVPTTLTSGSVAAYVDNSTTEITAGVTLTTDFDGRTGLHNVRIVATSGNGFAAQTNVHLIVTAGTVSGNSAVGYVIGSFSINNRASNVVRWAGQTVTTGDIAIKTTLAKTTHITGFNDISTANVQTELGTYGALRPTTAGRTLDVNATGETGIDWANIGAPTTTQNLSGTTIATVTNGVSLTSGERTTLAGVIWNVLTSTLTTVGSIGKLLVDNINATISSRSTYAGTDTSGTTTLLSRIASAITITSGKVDVNDKTGFGLSTAERSATADQVWDEVLSGHLTAGTTGAALNGAGAAGDPWGTALPGAYSSGTAGNILGNRVDVAVSTRATPAQVQTELGTYGGLKPTVAGRTLDITATGEAGVDLDNTVGTLAKGTDITGFNDIAAGTAMTLTSAYDAAKTAAQAGNAMTLTTAYDAAKTASTQASVDTLATYVDTEVAAIKAKTDQLTFSSGAVEVNLDLTDLNAMADAILKRDWTAISGESAYSLLNAVRMLRNKWDTASGTLTVKKEDGSTTAWTRALTVDPAAQPIVAAT